MKKILTALFLLSVLFLLGTAVYADGGSLSLKGEYVIVDLAKDNTFELKVSSTGTPAYTTGIVNVTFDKTVFELTHIAFNEDLAPNNATHLSEDETVDIAALTEYFGGRAEGTPVPPDEGTFTVSFGDDLRETNYTEAGVLFTLTFKVVDDNASGSYVIGLNEEEYSFLDSKMGAVTVSMTDGKVTAGANKPGDVNGDGKVNGLDVVRLRKYLNGWDVVIQVRNSNVNGDRFVNGLDLIRLRKFLNGWNVELK